MNTVMIITYLFEEELLGLIQDYFKLNVGIKYLSFKDKTEMLQKLDNKIPTICILDHDFKNASLTELIETIKQANKLHCFIIISHSGIPEQIIIDYFHVGCNKLLLKTDPQFFDKLVKYISDDLHEITKKLVDTTERFDVYHQLVTSFQKTVKDITLLKDIM